MAPGTDNPLEGLLGIEEAAEILDVAVPTLYRLISSGEIAAIKHGGKSWIERAEITDYWARKRAEAAKKRAQLAKASVTRVRARAAARAAKAQVAAEAAAEELAAAEQAAIAP